MSIARHQPLAPALGRHRIENRIERNQWIAGKEKLRDQTGDEARPEQGQMNMRRPPGVGMIEPRISAGLDRQVSVLAFFVGHAAPRAGKVGIERRVVLIDGMMIAPGGVGLPDFDQRIRHRLFVFIQDPADDDDALAHRFFSGVGIAREIVLARLQLDIAEQRPGDLRQSLLDRHEPFQRTAFDRRAISFKCIRRMRFPVARIVVLEFA